MYTISATDLNKHSGAILDTAIKEPVFIERHGCIAFVVLSYERYKVLLGEESQDKNISEDNLCIK